MAFSNSKSAGFLSPLNIKDALILSQKFTVRPSYVLTLIFFSFSKVFSINFVRSSIENIYFLFEFTPIAITISSKSGNARLMMSICPFVIGSNEPGKIAFFIG